LQNGPQLCFRPNRPEQGRRGIQLFFRALRYWMPPHRDAGQAPQVRHDIQKLDTFLHCGTASFAGVTLEKTAVSAAVNQQILSGDVPSPGPG